MNAVPLAPSFLLGLVFRGFLRLLFFTKPVLFKKVILLLNFGLLTVVVFILSFETVVLI